VGRAPTKSAIFSLLADGRPKSHREIVRGTGLSRASVWSALTRLWREGAVLTKEPLYESERVFRGRAGAVRTLRPYHLYLLRPAGRDRLRVDGREFVAFSEEYLDARGGRGKSKARLILEFLRENGHRAWFSSEIAKALRNRGVKQRDVLVAQDHPVLRSAVSLGNMALNMLPSFPRGSGSST